MGFGITLSSLAAAFLLAAAPSKVYVGHSVAYTGSKALQAYLIETPLRDGGVHLDLWESDNGVAIRRYDVDMTKLLHTIVVSDDLRDFQHIHPVLHPDGHFTIDVHTHERGLYHVYIDGIPHTVGREVFRFDIPVGSGAAAAAHRLNAPGNAQRAGPYTVTLDTVSVPFGEISTISVTITKDGKIAHDLHPYLGAMAHGVFIGTKDLAYMHGHGMTDQMLSMAEGDCGDSMMLSMPPLPATSTIDGSFSFELLAPSAQPYDFWLQFVGGRTLYTVPFLVTGR